MLNKDSLTLSVVGLVEVPLTVFRIWPFAEPEITLKISYTSSHDLYISYLSILCINIAYTMYFIICYGIVNYLIH